MAKRKTEDTGEELSFSSLIKNLGELSPESYMLSESPYVDIENFIGLGNYVLNAQVSGDIFGGVPEGRIFMVAGPPACIHPKQKIKIYKLKQNLNR